MSWMLRTGFAAKVEKVRKQNGDTDGKITLEREEDDRGSVRAQCIDEGRANVRAEWLAVTHGIAGVGIDHVESGLLVGGLGEVGSRMRMFCMRGVSVGSEADCNSSRRANEQMRCGNKK